MQGFEDIGDLLKTVLSEIEAKEKLHQDLEKIIFVIDELVEKEADYSNIFFGEMSRVQLNNTVKFMLLNKVFE